MKARIFFLILASLAAIRAEAGELTARKHLLNYVPPMRGAPASRVGGGSRGVGDTLPRLLVLAPDHTGLTFSEQPVLYWYVSKPATAHFEVTVINDRMVDPLVSKDFVMPVKAGIQKLRLADYGLKLEKGIEYRWFVSLVTDPEERSNDIIASGTIERVEPSADIGKKLAAARREEKAKILAEAGIWYDALATVSELAEEKPLDPAFREERDDLLEEVGLVEAASSGLSSAH